MPPGIRQMPILSLAVLASSVKVVGREGLSQSRPGQQEIKVFLVPLPPNLFLLPFPFAVGSSSPFSLHFSHLQMSVGLMLVALFTYQNYLGKESHLHLSMN